MKAEIEEEKVEEVESPEPKKDEVIESNPFENLTQGHVSRAGDTCESCQ